MATEFGGSFGAGGARGNVRPVRAPVVPRVCGEPGGAAVPLEDRVRGLLAAGQRGPVNVYGPFGSGKSTALAHLAAALPRELDVVLIDDGTFPRAVNAGVDAGLGRLVVYTSQQRDRQANVPTFVMGPWGPDDCIAYLVNTGRRGRVSSVLDRLKAGRDAGTGGAAPPASDITPASLNGLPELWRIVLDAFAGDDDLSDVPAALRHVFAARLADPAARDAVTAFCFGALRQEVIGDPAAVPRAPAAVPADGDRPPRPVRPAGADPMVRRLLPHRPVQLVLAAQHLAWELRRGAGAAALAHRLPGDLVREAGVLLSLAPKPTANLPRFVPPTAVDQLEGLVLGKDPTVHPLAASLLHACRCGWRPPRDRMPRLAGADLAGARWPGVDLAHADLADADLAGADLSRATLDQASAAGTTLRSACLRSASLRNFRAPKADLRSADLTRANAEGADLCDADLSGSRLDEARLTAARLDRTNLAGASLRSARLRRVKVDAAQVAGADLSGADATGPSSTPSPCARPTWPASASTPRP